MIRLTNEQRDYLRVLGHDLSTSIDIGAGGITPFVLQQIDHALARQELVRVRVPFGDRRRRSGVLAQLAPRSHATLVERDANAAILFRQADKPVIDLPGLSRTG